MRSIRRSLLSCLAAAAMTVAVVSSGSASPGSASAAAPAGGAPGVKVPTLRWTDCGGAFQCATAGVPRDYARPAGPAFRLAVIRVPARDRAHRIGSLFVNPGGPGASGVDFLRDAAPRLAALNRRFDLVSWDLRGVGASRPLVRCVAAADGPLIADARTAARHCVTRDRGVLPYLTTGNVARDLDVLRAAVGDDRLTYLGYSYGTAIGMTYISLFGDHQRAIVLDAAVDTTWLNDPLATDRRQAAGREVELRSRANGRFAGPFRTPESAPTTLVVGTTLDPATPYAEARALTATLSNARLLTLDGDGDGHGASFNGNGGCIDDAVSAYLVDGRLPAPRTVCRQTHQAFAG